MNFQESDFSNKKLVDWVLSQFKNHKTTEK